MDGGKEGKDGSNEERKEGSLGRKKGRNPRK